MKITSSTNQIPFLKTNAFKMYNNFKKDFENIEKIKQNNHNNDRLKILA